MQLPPRHQFAELAATGGVIVPVWRELLADGETPVSAYRALSEDATHAVLLESVEGGEHAAHFSIVAADPTRVHVIERAGVAAGSDPFALLDDTCAADVRTPDGALLPRFIGGRMGFLGYGCIKSVEQDLAEPAADVLDVPDAVLLDVDELIAFDHLRHRVVAIACAHVAAGASAADIDAAYDDACERIDALVERLARPRTPRLADVAGLRLDGGVVAPTSCNTEPDAFRAGVLAAKEHVAAGEVIQLVLSQRWTRPTDAAPFDIYRALRIVNPSPYTYFMQFGDLSIIGASPELLVQVDGVRVSTHPIAGTRRRGLTVEEDAALEAELLADPKERAEHVMLVDLGRNDIGRVAAPGSVRVERLMDVERFSNVMHLTSHVAADLRDGCTPVDALRSCFPAGTVSGAPKLRAMELIAELEPDRRGPYAGAVGCVGYGGALDMAITIRTLLMRDGVATVQAGAGIVADSDPDAEYEETRSKARAMLRAVDLAETFSGSGVGASEVGVR